MDDRSFEQLVRSVSREVASGAASAPRAGAGGGFFLVDSWRIRSSERERFLDYYVTHVAETMQELDGFREARVLVAAVESSYSWHVQVFYEFESDAVLDRFGSDFDRHLQRRFPGKTRERVLDEMGTWVLAHEDGALLEIDRKVRTS